MKHILRVVFLAALWLCGLGQGAVEAGFAGTDVFLPAVGSAVGVSPWFTTLWIANPDPVNGDTVTIYLLKASPTHPRSPSPTSSRRAT